MIINIKQHNCPISVRSWSILLIPVIVLLSCTGKTVSIGEKPLKASGIYHAKRLNIEKHDLYSKVTIINPWQGANGVIQTWYLVPRGKKMPFSTDSSTVIQVPVRKIICMSTTHLAMISAIGETASVIGISGTKLLYDSALLRKVKFGKIHEIGYDDNLNKELVIKLNPELVMVYGVGAESAGFSRKMKELGIRVIFNADYLEADPLGRAEWIKMMGALFSKEVMADSIFKSLEMDYNHLKSYISENCLGRPAVLLGLPFKDSWYISPGNSYISRLIEDAGGRYLWQSSESSVSMPVAIEDVFIKALNADFWLNTGSADSRSQMISIDPRLAMLPCFKKGDLYNNNKRITSQGGNDYWEGGTLRPHLILLDIATILHPELFPDRELIYYKKIN